MKSIASITSAAFATLAMAVTASADPIEERQEIMKERGALLRILGPIAQERQPFDADIVLDALERLNANAQASTDIDALWPEGTESGGDTESAPAVWSNRDGFKSLTDEYAAHAAAALEAAPQDLDAFRTVFSPVAASCGTCHEGYRL